MQTLKRMARISVLALSIPLIALAQPALALDILLTNDDGYNSHNIRALYSALKSVGHRVTISAPMENQSGKSSAILFLAPTQVGSEKADSAIHYVNGTPAMALMYGVDVLLGEAPDLVISGPNEGHNLGITTNISGTVGATVMALKRGIPAIAVSADRNEQNSPPAVIADIVVNLVATLEAGSDGGRLLPAGMALNVNMPPLQDNKGAVQVKGVKFTSVADYSGHTPIFVSRLEPYLTNIPSAFFANERDPSGEATKAYVGTQPGIAFGDRDQLRREETNTAAEGLWLEQGYITISPLNGSYGGHQGGELATMLDGLKLH